jgi:hypothetical protein
MVKLLKKGDEMKKATKIIAGVIIIMLALLTVPVQIFAGNLLDRIEVSPNSDRISVGDSTTFTATCYLGENIVTGVPIVWSSSDTGVAKIDTSSGSVTALASGTTTIQATYDDGLGYVVYNTATLYVNSSDEVEATSLYIQARLEVQLP